MILKTGMEDEYPEELEAKQEERALSSALFIFHIPHILTELGGI